MKTLFLPFWTGVSMSADDLSNFSMMDLFRAEVETHVAVLNTSLLGLERDPSSKTLLESLMRAAHSIKGAARIVQFDAGVQVAHALEDCFVAAQSGKVALRPDHMDVLLSCVDLLGRLASVNEADLQEWQRAHAPEIGECVSSIAAISSGGPSADPILEKAAALPSSALPEEILPPVTEDRHATLLGQTVRVDAGNLNRLMALAGEAMIAAGSLEPYLLSLRQLKSAETGLAASLERLTNSLESMAKNHTAQQHLTEMRQKMDQLRQSVSDRLSEMETLSRRSSTLSGRLYREALASRMRPFGEGVTAFPRMVRDLARALKKKVRLEVTGKSTRVDRDILEKLEAPLNHLLRNALDHGIESPEEREAAGKTPEALLALQAHHRAGMLQVTVSDDGRGVRFDQLRQKLMDKGLVSSEIAEKLTQQELLEFLFLPGFSTSDRVTEISGRGVGLDVVYNMVAEVGGTVRIVAQPGKGMTFHLDLPLTLSVMRALLVEIAGEPYAFPLSRVDLTRMVQHKEIRVQDGKKFFLQDGEEIEMILAHEVLELQGSNPGPGDAPVIVISDQLNRYALRIDRFLGQKDLVVRPLDQRLGKLQDIQAATILEDGTVALIVDVQDFVRSIDNRLRRGRARAIAAAAESLVPAKTRRKRILIVDDSGAVREAERRLLESRGYAVDTAVNGMDGWNAVRARNYDLVLTDMDMPRMNGVELVLRIREDARLRELPVIVVSYKDREEDRKKGIEAGANLYITKGSIHEDTLAGAVAGLIGEP